MSTNPTPNQDEVLEILWQLATAVSSYPLTSGKTLPTRIKEKDIAEAHQTINRLIREAEQVHIDNYAWLLGVKGSFPQSERGRIYGWRSELREKIPKDMLYRINNLTTKGDTNGTE